MNRFPTAICAAVCACMIAGAAPSLRAQAPSDLLKTFETERDKAEEEVFTRFEAMVAAGEAEIQAGKMTPEAARTVRQQFQELRGNLRWLDSYEFKESEKKEPATTSPLNKAREEFSAAVKARQAFRTEKLSQVRDGVIQNVLSTWKKAEREEDLNGALDLLREVERVLPQNDPVAQRPGLPRRGNLPWHMSNSASGPASAPLSSVVQELSRLLTASQRFLAALATGDARQVGNAFNQLQANGSSQWAKVVSPAEVDQWRTRFTEKAIADVVSLQEQADSLMAKSSPSKEVLPVVEKLLTAMDRKQALGGSPGTGNDVNSARESLRAWSKVLQTAESGDWRGVQRDRALVGGAPDWLSPAGRQGFYARLKEADEGRAAAEKAVRVQMEQQIRERLAKITDGASALTVADELPIEPNSTGDGTRERLVALQSDLKRLAASWNAQSGAALSSELLREGGAPHPWQADVRALRSKILRENIAKTSNLPELLAAPLDALPLDTAIRKLGAALKENQDWKRLHDLLATARPGYDRGDSGQNDELRGVKAFLTGQNFERAEQYGDAVQAYRAVMSCIGELVPVEATAERLKAIAREHPEAVAPAARPGASAQPVSRAVGEAVR